MEVLYLGPKGSYSNAAAELMFRSKPRPDRPADDFFPIQSFDKIYSEILKNPDKIGVIPLENSISGDISSNLDKFFSGKFKIAREIYLKIEHHLLTKQSSNLNKIKKVYLDPQIKIQCSEFLKKHSDWEQIIVSSTSEGARLVSESDSEEIAAIASLSASELYSLKIQARDISNIQNNYTRFIAVIKELTEFPSGNADKCSVSFEMSSSTGSLYKALKSIHDKKYNLTKIGSKLVSDKLWEYRFYIDFTFNDILDLEEFEKSVKNMTIIGIYEKGRVVQS